MKKIISLLIILCVGLPSLFAGQSQTYITGAYNYGMFTERSDTGTSKMSANAIDLSVSAYFYENWGLYLNSDYNFVSQMDVISGGSKGSLSSADWNWFMILSCIIGPTYKYRINNQTEVFGALGFHIAQTSLDATSATMLNYSFGIGGDIGVRYLPSRNFYIAGGFLFSHDFYCSGESYVSGYGSTTASGKYNFGSIRPYLGVGYTFNELF